ncbi:MAG: hypothetical protein COA52_02660 [Hyphomicrobiales bacterium]|nr:MAG: hypothetical protein COA52_02660 [Hyphomicrobiales bacterium]
MTITISIKGALKAAIGFGLASSVFALAGCGSPTYGTGRNPQIAMIEELTGNLTGTKKKQDPIEYKARSELVLPPSAQLPSPEEKSSIAQMAAWPNDPDVNKAVNTSGEIPEEFRRGRLARGSIKKNTNVSPIDITEMNTAQRLDAQRKFREQLAAMGPGDGTTRKYLTDPPVEYRKPSANAPQPEDLATDTAPRTLFGSMWKRFRK